MRPAVPACLLVCLAVVVAGCYQEMTAPSPQRTAQTPVHGITPHEPDDPQNVAAAARAQVDTNLFDIDYEDAPLGAIVDEFAELTDAAIIVPEELDGTITCRFIATPWRLALEEILAGHGYRLYECHPDSRVFRVIKIDPNAPEPIFAEVFLFDTPDEAVEFADAVQKIYIGPRGRVAAVPSRNAMFVVETKHTLRQIRQGIAATKPTAEKVKKSRR